MENGTLLEGNQARGAAGGAELYGPYIPAGDACGGALYVAGGTANITDTTLTGNWALGGPPVPGLLGGSAYGGALYVAAGQVVLTTTTATNNGALPTGPSSRATGYGGGFFIANGATVDIDAFTLSNVVNNTAPIDPNIDGTYFER